MLELYFHSRDMSVYFWGFANIRRFLLSRLQPRKAVCHLYPLSLLVFSFVGGAAGSLSFRGFQLRSHAMQILYTAFVFCRIRTVKL